MFLNHIHNQAGFAKPVINGRDFFYLGISKMVFTLGKLERPYRFPYIADHIQVTPTFELTWATPGHTVIGGS